MKDEFRTMWSAAGLYFLAAMFTTQANAQLGNPTGQLILAPPMEWPSLLHPRWLLTGGVGTD